MVTFPTPTTDGQIFSTDRYDFVWDLTAQKWLQKQSNPSLKHRLLSDSASISLDLSAQSSFEISIKGQSLAPSVSFVNPPSDSGKFTVKVKNDLDISRSSFIYTNKFYDVDAPIGREQTISTRGVAFSSDGTRMFMGDENTRKVYQFDLTTPWDIQSRVYNGVSFLLTNIAASLTSNITFSHDGKYFFSMKTDTMFLYRVDLSTAWDLSTASYKGVFVDLGAKVSLADVTSETQVQFNFNSENPGTKMFFILGNFNMYEVDFLTPYDLPNAVYGGVTKNLRTVTGRASGKFIGFTFNSAGNRIILTDTIFNDIMQINMSVAYSVGSNFTSVATSFANGSIPSETGVRGIYLKQDETKIYVAGATLYSIYELNIPANWTSPFNFYYAGNFVKFSRTTNTSGTGTSSHFSLDGKTLFLISGLGFIFQFDLRIPWDISSMVYANKFLDYSSFQNNSNGIYVSPDGIHVFILGTVDDQIEYFRMSRANDISTAVHVSSTTFTSLPNGLLDLSSIWFSKDGTRLFMTNSSSIYWWNLSTPWTLSTATYVTSYAFSSYTSVTTLVTEIAFSERGDVLYFLENYFFNAVFSVRLSTPWSPNTGTNAVEALRHGSQTRNAEGFAISRNSDKIFIQGPTNTQIFEYASIAPLDTITEAPRYVAARIIPSASTSAKPGIYFKSDGTRMWFLVSGINIVYQSELTTAWDVRTIQASTVSLTLDLPSSSPAGISFSKNGDKLYILAANGTTATYLAEIPLTQAWNISSAVLASKTVITISTATYGTVTVARGLHIDQTGTRVYVGGSAGSTTHNTIFYYTMSTPYTLSTLSAVQGSTTVVSTSWAFSLNSSGTELYVNAWATTGAVFRKYTLSVPWLLNNTGNVSSPVSYNYSSGTVQQNYASSMYIRNDISEMYIGNDSPYSGAISEFTNYDSPYSIQWPQSVQWENKTAPRVPNLDNTSVIDFYTTDGGVSYKGVERISTAYNLQSLY